MIKSLLPPNVTPLERTAAIALAEIERLPLALRNLWDANHCPLALLPYLAWACSVDHWDNQWPESTKRAVVKIAYEVHRKKGTLGAVRRVMESLGYRVDLIEWWQHTPTEIAGTFRLAVRVLDRGMSQEGYAELERLIDDAKPASRHMLSLEITIATCGSLYVGANTYDGNTMTVFPDCREDINTASAFSISS